MLALDEVSDWIGRPDTFVWVGLRMPDRDEMERVCGFCGLKAIDVDEAIAPHERPVVTSAEGVTWLVLRTARYNDEREEVDLGELSVMFTDDLVVTVRYGQASPLDGGRRELQDAPRPSPWASPPWSPPSSSGWSTTTGRPSTGSRTTCSRSSARSSPSPA